MLKPLGCYPVVTGLGADQPRDARTSVDLKERLFGLGCQRVAGNRPSNGLFGKEVITRV